MTAAAQKSKKTKKTSYWKLRIKLLLLVLFASLPLYFSNYLAFIEQRNKAFQDAELETTRLVSVSAVTSEGLVDTTHRLLSTLAKFPEIREREPEECSELLAQVLNDQEEARYLNFGVIELNGDIYCTGLPATNVVNASDRLYFRRAIDKEGFSIGEYQIGRITGKPSVNFGHAVFENDGQINGVVFTALSLEYLNVLASQANFPENAVLNMFDEKGTVFVRYPDPENWLGENVSESSLIQELSELNSDEGNIVSIGFDGIERLYAFRKVKSESGSVFVVVGFPITEISNHSNDIFKQNLIGTAIVTILGIILTLFLSERLIVKQAKELNASKAKDEAILESIGDGVIATDHDGKIIIMNSAAQQMTGWSINEAKGKKVVELLPMLTDEGKKVNEGYRPMQKALSEGKKISEKYYYRRKDGSKFPVNITITPIILEEEIIGTIEVFYDISKEVQIDQAKTEFISLASHQLRTPLTTMKWYLEVLLKGKGGAGEPNDKQREYMDIVSQSNQRMIDLVNALLNVSRIDMGRFIVEPEPIMITEIAKQIITDIEPTANEKNINFVVEMDEGIGEKPLDKKLTGIIFQNLLSNAVKYTPEGGEVRLSINKEEEYINITVKDTGMGIPENQQKKIFTKLFRADNVKQTETVGTGLGLYIVKAIVDQVGGKIQFESKEGKGTTFKVSLPIAGMKQKSGEKELELD